MARPQGLASALAALGTRPPMRALSPSETTDGDARPVELRRLRSRRPTRRSPSSSPRHVRAAEPPWWTTVGLQQVVDPPERSRSRPRECEFSDRVVRGAATGRVAQTPAHITAPGVDDGRKARPSAPPRPQGPRPACVASMPHVLDRVQMHESIDGDGMRRFCLAVFGVLVSTGCMIHISSGPTLEESATPPVANSPEPTRTPGIPAGVPTEETVNPRPAQVSEPPLSTALES